ncbi:MAG: methyltransferase domain-containing protein [Enhygromyxa sp.]
MTETKSIHEPLGQGISVIYELAEIIVERTTPYQHLMIAETPAYGRALFLDGLIQSSETDECLWHEPLIHPAVCIHGDPKRVLVGGAGEGASMRELLRHSGIESIVAVDLDPAVVDACREHLPSWHQGSYDDPRVELRFEDVQQTLARAADGSYDLIVLDITDPVEEGPSVDLFTVRFFSEVKRVLADDGIMVLQAGELDPYDMRVARTVRSTLAEVFEWGCLLQTFVPSFHALWSVRLAGKRSFDTTPADLGERIAKISGLQMYDLDAHQALLHLPRFLAERLAEPGRVVTGETEARLLAFEDER